jgi:membrane-associated phospholipid phosphatase
VTFPFVRQPETGRKLRSLAAGGVLLVLALSGCGDATAPRYDNPEAVEPAAGSWRTWVIPGGSAFRPGSPPSANSSATKSELAELTQLASQRTPEVITSIDYWNGGTVRRWSEIQRSFIRTARPNPVRASRGLALVSVAMYDALVAAWDAKYAYERPRPFQLEGGPPLYGPEPVTPSYVSERAAVSAAAADVLEYLFPAESSAIQAALGQATNADLYSGAHFPSDVEAGARLGHDVAAMVLARARADYSDNTTPPVARIMGDGCWVPTPPANIEKPVEPGAGLWRTWVLPNGHALRPNDPPPFDSPEFRAQIQEVWEVNQSLAANPLRLDIANYWADGPGTNTPPGHWNQIAVDMALEKGLNEPRTARMLALLGVAQADAFIACWDCKFSYWCVRPVTEIRKTFDPSWLPPVPTPPFPSFPSGHSTTSGAASTVLGYIFPDEAVRLSQMGIEAMNSRLYGGIHFTFDNLTGFSLGTAIGGRVVVVAASDGADTGL